MATETAIDVVMPQMGVSVSEGTVTKWLKQEGEHVEADEPLLEISTDKVDTEVPSPGSGVLTEILVQEGQTVDVGTLLGRVGGGGGSAPPPAPPEPAAEEPTEPAAVAEEPEPEPPPVPREPEPQPETDGHDHTFVSPVVARIAAEHGIDPSTVEGTGAGGRVTKKDILAFVESGASTKAGEAEVSQPPRTTPAPPSAPPASATASAAPTSPPPAQPGETIEPMNAMRRGIAEHMRRSLDTAAHVTSAIEVDMAKVVAIREKLKPEYERAY